MAYYHPQGGAWNRQRQAKACEGPAGQGRRADTKCQEIGQHDDPTNASWGEWALMGPGSKASRKRQGQQHQGGRYRQESDWKVNIYTVRKTMVKDILFRLQVREPDFDVFAGIQTGQQLQDVLSKSWSGKGLLWCCPPVGVIHLVIQKMVDEKLMGIVIAPHFVQESYFAMAQPHIVRKYFYKRGVQLFEQSGELIGGLPWAVWAWLVDGEQVRDQKREYEEGEEPKAQRTAAARRRWRRKYKYVEIC